ncbi:MAG: hypothetical protein JWM16_2472 [Verrucomicrobiales bacterium]|nr:hypothetical protein [Verrucomicrobiales bacterium]
MAKSFPLLFHDRWGRLVRWSLALVLVYTVVGFFVLPVIIRYVAVKQLTQLLDRQAQVERVRINPYTFSCSIQGLSVTDKDGERLLGLKEGYANFQLVSIFQHAWGFKEVRVVEPYGRVQVNKDSSLNFSDLLVKFGGTANKGEKKAIKPPSLRINQLHISGGEMSFVDLTSKTPFRRRIGPVQLTLTELHTDPDSKNPYSFSGTTDFGERFSWSGYFFLDPLQSRGQLAVENVALAQYAPAYQDFVRFDIRDGVIDLRADYDFQYKKSLDVAAVTNASFHLRSLKLAPRGETNSFAALEDLTVSGVSADAVAHRVVADSVSLRGGALHVVRATNAEINFVEMARPASTNLSGSLLLMLQTATNLFAQLASSTNAGVGLVKSLAVTNCTVAFEDRAGARPVQLSVTDISMAATNLSNVPGAQMGGVAGLRWNTNGTLEAGFGAQLSPALADVNFKVDRLELSPLGPYLDPYVSLFLVGSKFSMDGRVQLQYTNGAGPNATYSGNLRLEDFSGEDAQSREPILGWGSVAASGIQAGLNPPEFNVAEVSLNDFTAHVVLETNRTLNLMRVARLNRSDTGSSNGVEAAASAEASQSSTSMGKKLGLLARAFSSTNLAFLKSPLKVRASLVTLSNATIQLEDRSIAPAASLAMRSASGKITGLSSTLDREIQFDLATKVDGTGPVLVSGTLPPASVQATNHVKAQVQNVNLAPAGTYAGKYLGYGLRKGILNLEVNYEMTAHRIRAQNLITLDQFTLGDKVASSDATKLPVKLAVAILKDRKGLIELNVPIEGNLDDPEFKLGGAILHVMGNIMTKLVTSPFAMLGSIFGGKGEDVGYQSFGPGSTNLLTGQGDKLDALLKGLQERPGLQLGIEGSFDEKADAEALRRQKLEQRFRAEKWQALPAAKRQTRAAEKIEFSPAEFDEALNRAYGLIVKVGQSDELAQAKSGTNSSAIAASRPTAALKGGEMLMVHNPLVPAAPISEVEQAVLRTITVGDDDLKQLAMKRAAQVQAAIFATGLIETGRVSVLDFTSPDATNRAARVFFHLQ